MRKLIALVTREGDHVVDRLIPPFITMPDVVLWGDRVFMLRDQKIMPIVKGSDKVFDEVYHECFAYHSIGPLDEPTI